VKPSTFDKPPDELRIVGGARAEQKIGTPQKAACCERSIVSEVSRL